MERQEQVKEIVNMLESAIKKAYQKNHSDIENAKQLINSSSPICKLIEDVTNYIPDNSIVGITGSTFPESKTNPAPKEHAEAVTIYEIIEYVSKN